VRLTENAADSWAPSIAVQGQVVHVAWFDRRHAGATDYEIEEQANDVLDLLGLPSEPIPPRDPATYYLPPFQERIRTKMDTIQKAIPDWGKKGGDPQQIEQRLQRIMNSMAAWQRGWEIFYRRSTDGGSTWGEPVRLTEAAGESLRPSLAVAGSNVHIAWFDKRHGPAEIYYRQSLDKGVTWSPVEQMTDSGDRSERPSIALTADTVHIVWVEEGRAVVYGRRLISD
jgi:hypothetical protein